MAGAELARWRARLDLTQQAAADRLGVRQGTISKAESRADVPLGPSLCEALAEELDAERLWPDRCRSSPPCPAFFLGDGRQCARPVLTESDRGWAAGVARDSSRGSSLNVCTSLNL